MYWRAGQVVQRSERISTETVRVEVSSEKYRKDQRFPVGYIFGNGKVQNGDRTLELLYIGIMQIFAYIHQEKHMIMILLLQRDFPTSAQHHKILVYIGASK